MMPGGKTYTIDTSTAAVAGNATAPVTVVAYLCVRCPYCARLAPALYQSVTAGIVSGLGRTGGRVRLSGERVQRYIQPDAAINPGN